VAVECGPISELNGQSKMSLRAGTNIQGRERPESRSFAELLVDVEEALPAWAIVFELLAEIDVSASRVTADTANGPRIH
jgi:hypothetical protein